MVETATCAEYSLRFNSFRCDEASIIATVAIRAAWREFLKTSVMGLRTPLYNAHVALGARIVDFGGWDMPLHYGSQIQEHHCVRTDAGMFDVSHMCAIDLTGARTREYLRHLLANDVGKLQASGQALYSCMLSPSGAVLDDLIVYRMMEAWFRLVVNAGTRATDLAWIEESAKDFGVEVCERRDLALIAIQGPNARARVAAILHPMHRYAALDIAPFTGARLGYWFVARTGYTGEDGFELMLPAQDAADAWYALSMHGVTPAGLGARDTLRLEAGMNLHGNDMDEDRHPLESGLEWTVAFEPSDRQFIGRSALEAARDSCTHELVGLVLHERGVLRGHQPVFAHADDGASGSTTSAIGEITSGTFSPTLNRAIALARVRRGVGAELYVGIRGKRHAARVVKPPFVRNGKAKIKLEENAV